jgi:hypothetical protein
MFFPANISVLFGAIVQTFEIQDTADRCRKMKDYMTQRGLQNAHLLE